jgi:hypothetical protein
MADILDFRAHECKAARKTSQGAGAPTCEIVIFPGVRYERSQAVAEKAKAGRKRVKRDTLQLTD